MNIEYMYNEIHINNNMLYMFFVRMHIYKLYMCIMLLKCYYSSSSNSVSISMSSSLLSAFQKL